MQTIRRLQLAFLALIGIMVIGTIGYRLIEQWPILNAFYMTIITISAVGFKEIAPLTTKGRIFTIGLILIGVGTVGYTLGTVIEFPL